MAAMDDSCFGLADTLAIFFSETAQPKRFIFDIIKFYLGPYEKIHIKIQYLFV